MAPTRDEAARAREASCAQCGGVVARGVCRLGGSTFAFGPCAAAGDACGAWPIRVPGARHAHARYTRAALNIAA